MCCQKFLIFIMRVLGEVLLNCGISNTSCFPGWERIQCRATKEEKSRAPSTKRRLDEKGPICWNGDRKRSEAFPLSLCVEFCTEKGLSASWQSFGASVLTFLFSVYADYFSLDLNSEGRWEGQMEMGKKKIEERQKKNQWVLFFFAHGLCLDSRITLGLSLFRDMKNIYLRHNLIFFPFLLY